MRTCDASSMIHAWVNYPVANFPQFWDWIAEDLDANNLHLCKVAYNAVKRKMEPCANWLDGNGVNCTDVTNDIAQEAVRIKQLLGIQKFSPRGVDDNDLLIIATARLHGVELVTEENRQNTLPSNMAHYKIPAVCAHADVRIPCVNWVALIQASGRRFG